MNDHLQAIELVGKLEAFLNENAAPIPNENALRTIRYLCNRISSIDAYMAEKCGDIENLANIFYNIKKHHDDADSVYQRIITNLYLIRRRIKNIH